ncbi:glycosyltransferase family protein [Candidatus Collinsella stercoripullorum]|uniref:hypothetical protein n=1 Tax=Candidatus Collinsella stercoripullorum TaxID=2838522 RepID=UPI0022E672B8|nr:hypothetical protein [Candidatus Collinsella stercoripullorum]
MMLPKVWIELSTFNGVVTDDYMRAIGGAYATLGHEVEYVDDVVKMNGSNTDIYVVLLAVSACKLRARGKKRIVFWSQGIWPEESFMKHGSRLRLFACNAVEKMALSVSERIFVVSNAQLRHFETKYQLRLRKKSLIMACSNESFHEESFYAEGKYEKPVFVYAGSLAQYQCIDETLEAFKRAQTVTPNASLMFLTNDIERARELVARHALTNVSVDHADKDELPAILSHAKYGFVIRDDSAINRVSTPTKISTYIANGVIPIYSPTIEAFSESAHNIVRLRYERESFAEDYREFETLHLKPIEMCNSYAEYFDEELSYDNAASRILAFLEGLN